MKTYATFILILIFSGLSSFGFASNANLDHAVKIRQMLKDRGILSHQPYHGLINTTSSQKGNVFIHRGDYMVSEVLTQFWTEVGWENAGLETYFYNTDGLVTELIIQNWENGGWVNSLKEVYAYDENDLNISISYKQWDGEAGDWIDFALATLTYDPLNDLLMEIMVQISFGTDWFNAFYSEYTYNNLDMITSFTTYEWDLIFNDWVNSSQDSFTYNFLNQIEVVVVKIWENNDWLNNMHTGYAYSDEGQNIYTLERSWDAGNNVWLNEREYIYTYNTNDDMVHKLIKVWNGEWAFESQTQYVYDENNNLETELIQIWADPVANREWNDQRLLTYNYNLVGINDPVTDINKAGTLVVYPNPATLKTNIMIHADQAGKASFAVLDNRGALVYEQAINMPFAGSHIIEWNIADNIPSGVYIVQVEEKGKIAKGKVMIAR